MPVTITPWLWSFVAAAGVWLATIVFTGGQGGAQVLTAALTFATFFVPMIYLTAQNGYAKEIRQAGIEDREITPAMIRAGIEALRAQIGPDPITEWKGERIVSRVFAAMQSEQPAPTPRLPTR